MQLEHKQFNTHVTTDRKGIVEAIVAVFGNTDNANEVIMPGAFAKTLATRIPKGVWAHDWRVPIAKTLEAREVTAGEKSARGGLFIKSAFNLDTQRGREAYSDIEFGIIDEFSIGYRVVKEAVDNDTGARELHELELFEFSPVLVGMNPETELLRIKQGVAPTFADQAASTLSAVANFTSCGKAMVSARAKEGRVISAVNRTRISAAVDAIRGMQVLADDLDALLVLAEPEKEKATDDEVRMLYAEFLRSQQTFGRK